ncbi:hypothetical protein BKA81DRAFT_359496 [Phyllosticta paracitricarpa]
MARRGSQKKRGCRTKPSKTPRRRLDPTPTFPTSRFVKRKVEAAKRDVPPTPVDHRHYSENLFAFCVFIH